MANINAHSTSVHLWLEAWKPENVADCFIDKIINKIIDIINMIINGIINNIMVHK